MKVAYLGIPGSYSYIAGINNFKGKKTMIGCNSIKKIFAVVTDDICQFGVIPLENSTTGSIMETYDLFLNSELFITGEIILQIHHHLIGVNKTSRHLGGGKLSLRSSDSPDGGESNKEANEPEQILKNIKKCYSHPQAIAQCRNFFNKHEWIESMFTSDTASAVKLISQHEDISETAIGASLAAKIYKLKILENNIEDNAYNFTRFAIISKELNGQGDKVSLIFSVEHKPGSLFKTLEPYARLGLNLTKIESRPVFGKPWEYIFFIDFEIGKKEKEIRQLLEKMKKNVNFLIVLGRYEKGKVFEA